MSERKVEFKGVDGLATLLILAILVGFEIVPLAVTASNEMDELNSRLETIMGETISFLDRAWEVAKRFQDPDYKYDPSDLGGFIIPEVNGTR